MKLEKAIIYLLASSGHGMKTAQIAREINARGLYARRDGQPVTDKPQRFRVKPGMTGVSSPE